MYTLAYTNKHFIHVNYPQSIHTIFPLFYNFIFWNVRVQYAHTPLIFLVCPIRIMPALTGTNIL